MPAHEFTKLLLTTIPFSRLRPSSVNVGTRQRKLVQ